jgi:hypothetical protein
MKNNRILDRGMWASLLKVLSRLSMWAPGFGTVFVILDKFFLLQHKAVLFPKRYVVTQVDHPYDALIPFNPAWDKIYMDFSPFWVRTQAFLLDRFGKTALPSAIDFVNSIGKLYCFSSTVYKQNFSTTNRPAYYKSAFFKIIHAVDPHLMCIPSLHVIVVVWTYIKMRLIMRDLGAEADYEHELQELRTHAIAITESVLYVKQHSINCISAALYTLSCWDPVHCGMEESVSFIDDLFLKPDGIAPQECKKIKAYIKKLYLSFLEAYNAEKWEAPLLDFLKNYQTKLDETMAAVQTRNADSAKTEEQL